ncbi:Gfo/Idh/MocA family protein [Roseomonas harenae]|uniref:Gfo/Idh/MocA family protein n=1 Tax=Muricoccus harenae TaxID=2692566 RepID=UPI001F38149D|nr:Gfo/Idh/MocA family oxidoreductase [Roseomonas harenae]
MLDAALVGMGRWGQTLVDSVQGRNGTGIRFVAGATRTPGRARAWATEKGLDLLPDLDAVLADPRVKAVVLATPHKQHAEQVIAAARAGKHVFVEKPFTLSKASAEAAVAACREAGVVMALGHNRRFLPAVLEMKRLLAEGVLGTLLHVEGQISGANADNWKAGMWRADPHESPLGGMGAMGIHMIDAMINLAGPIERVSVISQAQVLTNGLDDTTAMLCRFHGGPTGLFATLASAPRVWRLALFGSQGRVEQRDLETLVFHPRQGEGWERRFDSADIERAELEAFAAAVAGGPAYPLPLEDAIHGVSVFETMIHANASGGPALVP